MEKTWYVYAAHTIYGLGAVLSEKRIPEREDDLYAELRYERVPELIEHVAKDGVAIVVGKPCDAATAVSMYVAIKECLDSALAFRKDNYTIIVHEGNGSSVYSRTVVNDYDSK